MAYALTLFYWLWKVFANWMYFLFSNPKCSTSVFWFWKLRNILITNQPQFLSFQRKTIKIIIEIPIKLWICSIFVGDFNAKCGSWLFKGAGNHSDTELFTISNILGYLKR